jgi:hypothetical protein
MAKPASDSLSQTSIGLIHPAAVATSDTLVDKGASARPSPALARVPSLRVSRTSLALPPAS